MTDLLTAIGGRQALDRIVEDFYARVQSDEMLRPVFVGVTFERLVAMQQGFLAAALLGETQRTGVDLTAAHAGRGITLHHFDRFVELFIDSLEVHGTDRDTVQAVVHHLSLYADEVLGTPVEAG